MSDITTTYTDGSGAHGHRDKIIAAMMALLAEEPFERIGLSDVAKRAGVSLAQMRAEFSSTLSILAAQIKDTDQKVLLGGDADMAEESPREKLFDVLMRRLEILSPHRQAIRSLMRSATRNPGLGVCAQRSRRAIAKLDAQRRRHQGRRSEGHAARAGPRACCSPV